MMQLLTGWSGGRVLYFGDHPYSDLADVTLGKNYYCKNTCQFFYFFFKSGQTIHGEQAQLLTSYR